MNVLKRIKKQLVFGLINSLFIGTHAFDIKRKLMNGCEGVKIGNGTKVVTPIHIPCLSVFEVGDNCWIGRDFTLEGNGEVHIGSNCDLGPAVTCVTGTHEVGDEQRRAGEGYNSVISIGNGSWIGTRAILLPNTQVGNGVIVGASSVVTKELDDNKVYVGNPVKEMREL